MQKEQLQEIKEKQHEANKMAVFTANDKNPSESLEGWVKAREAFYANVEQERISALKRLNEATYRVEKEDHSIQQLGSRV